MNFPIIDLKSNECKLDFWNVSVKREE